MLSLVVMAAVVIFAVVVVVLGFNLGLMVVLSLVVVSNGGYLC